MGEQARPFCITASSAQPSSFHPYNIGHLASRASDPMFAPCTPSGVIRLLEFTGIPIAGAHAVVLGRSDIVGNPVASMLRRRDATVTQCHSLTRDVEEYVTITAPAWCSVHSRVRSCFDRSKPRTFLCPQSAKQSM